MKWIFLLLFWKVFALQKRSYSSGFEERFYFSRYLMSQNFRFRTVWFPFLFFDDIIHFNQLLPALDTSPTPEHRPDFFPTQIVALLQESMHAFDYKYYLKKLNSGLQCWISFPCDSVPTAFCLPTVQSLSYKIFGPCSVCVYILTSKLDVTLALCLDTCGNDIWYEIKLPS